MIAGAVRNNKRLGIRGTENTGVKKSDEHTVIECRVVLR